MNDTIILNSKDMEKGSDFILKIKDIKNLHNITLDEDNLLYTFNKGFENENFEVSNEALYLLEQILSDKLRITDYKEIYIGEKILYTYRSIDTNNVFNIINTYIDIDKYLYFNNVRVGIERSERLSKIIEKVKSIKNTINIETELKRFDIIELKDIGNLEEIEILHKLLDINTTDYIKDKANKIIQSLSYNINKRIEISKEYTVDKRIETVRSIFQEIYEVEFYQSEELMEIIDNNRYFDTKDYNHLKENIDCAYLIYRFNICKDIDSKVLVLFDKRFMNFIEVGKFNQEYIVKNIVDSDTRFINYEEFYLALDKLIKVAIANSNKFSIPV